MKNRTKDETLRLTSYRGFNRVTQANPDGLLTPRGSKNGSYFSSTPRGSMNNVSYFSSTPRGGGGTGLAHPNSSSHHPAGTGMTDSSMSTQSSLSNTSRTSPRPGSPIPNNREVIVEKKLEQLRIWGDAATIEIMINSPRKGPGMMVFEMAASSGSSTPCAGGSGGGSASGGLPGATLRSTSSASSVESTPVKHTADKKKSRKSISGDKSALDRLSVEIRAQRPQPLSTNINTSISSSSSSSSATGPPATAQRLDSEWGSQPNLAQFKRSSLTSCHSYRRSEKGGLSDLESKFQWSMRGGLGNYKKTTEVLSPHHVTSSQGYLPPSKPRKKFVELEDDEEDDDDDDDDEEDELEVEDDHDHVNEIEYNLDQATETTPTLQYYQQEDQNDNEANQQQREFVGVPKYLEKNLQNIAEKEDMKTQQQQQKQNDEAPATATLKKSDSDHSFDSIDDEVGIDQKVYAQRIDK